ncbi:MAG: hypothetical protein E7630_01010 [Ruminococcaceae bacterium]|nr:hypothetical protein [Oscillospiraceae bacterium]
MNDAVIRLSEAIRALACPCGILLYGAKQDLPAEGVREVNLCVIVRDDPKAVEQMLYRSLDSELAFNLLVYREEDWYRLTADPTSYASGIARKGILLYGKA